MAENTLRPARVAVQQAGAALASGAWLIDHADRAIFVASGKHRARFLHNFTTCDINGLAEGQSVWGAVTNGQGGVVAQALVDGEGETVGIEVDRALRDEVIAHLLKYRIADRVEFEPRDDLAVVALVGDGAQGVLDAVGLPWPADEMRHTTVDWRGVQVRVRRNPFRWATTGVDLTTAAGQDAETLANALTEAGAQTPDEARVAAHRVAFGIPRDRVDVDPETTPLEAAYLRPIVNWNKGCYLGQEVICMMEDLGKPRKQLVELAFDAGATIDGGTDLASEKGKTVGKLTTVAAIDGARYGLALVKRKSAKAGTRLTAGGSSATVVGLAGVQDAAGA